MINTNPLDQVTLVNSQDQVLGSMDKTEAHRGNAVLHRAISVYLFRKHNNQVELLIQQRSANKIVGAHQWANTVCGNVRPTENYEECAHRRLVEELGIHLPHRGRTSSEQSEPDKRGFESEGQLVPLYKFEYHLHCNSEFSEWEMDQVFVGWYDEAVTPNPEEVQNFRWVDWDELLQKSPHAELQTNEFNIKLVELRSEQYVLSPWFVYMLEDPELLVRLSSFLPNTYYLQ